MPRDDYRMDPDRFRGWLWVGVSWGLVLWAFVVAVA